MKIQCSVCETSEATVLCCADEAALCWTCDEKVHAANKLASKHQRVLLSNSNSQMPKCDICQESVGYFFCLEDRALLCRKCDVAIHTVNTMVSAHKRFLLTGVKVGLEAADPAASPSSRKSNSSENIPEVAKSTSLTIPSGPLSSADQYSKAAGAGDFVPPNFPSAGGSSAESIQQWQFDEFLGLTDLDQNYNFIDHVPSKVDIGKLVDSDRSHFLRAMEVELDGDGLGQVRDAAWAVPQIHSTPTPSGFSWPKTHHHDPFDTAAFVPDICYSPMPDLYRSQQNTNGQKRRRQF